MEFAVAFLAMLFGIGVALGYARLCWWIVPVFLGIAGAVPVIWLWVETAKSNCNNCEYEGLGQAIALFLTIALALAWAFGSVAFAAGAAFGRRLRDGDQAPALFK